MRRPFGLALLAAALAGCLSGGAPELPAPPALVPGPLAPLAYACPPGPTVELPGDLCVRTLADPRETYEEPYLAVHPARPEVMALGLNAWHADPRPVLGPHGPGTELVRMTVLVTEDGGATWRQLALPPTLFGNPQAVLAHGTADPALAFDAAGTLHVTQLNAGFSGPFWFDVQYMATPDLGRTWTEPLLLQADGDNDRNWLTVGPDGTLWVAWRNTIQGPAPPQLTWSRDGGRTWAEPTGPEGCTNGARPLPWEGGALLACELRDGDGPTGIVVHHFEASTGAWTLRSQVAAPEGWDPGETLYSLADLRPDGTLAVATRQGTPGAFLAVSRDAGRTWEPPTLLADLCTACAGAAKLVGYWAEFDGRGGLHLLLRDGYMGTPDAPNEDNVRYALGEVATWHVVVDVDRGAAVQDKLLTGPDPGFRRVPPSAAPPIGRDDYYAPAYWGDGGALVWTRDVGIDLTLLQPVAPEGL